MTSITTTVRTHRRGLAVVGALAVLVLAAVALLLFNTSPAHDLHHLVTGYHFLPQFVRSLPRRRTPRVLSRVIWASRRNPRSSAGTLPLTHSTVNPNTHLERYSMNESRTRTGRIFGRLVAIWQDTRYASQRLTAINRPWIAQRTSARTN